MTIERIRLNVISKKNIDRYLTLHFDVILYIYQLESLQ